MPLIPFPNVPKLPGVPQLKRAAVGLIPGPVLGTALAIGRLWQALDITPQWGIFDQQMNQMVKPDNIMDFGYVNDANVATFPVERGSFVNYNKVQNSFEVLLRFTKGGSKADREQFVRDLEALQFSIGLFNVLTPERTYRNVNLTRVQIARRGVIGAYFFADVDVRLLEIREVTPQYTTASAPTSNAADVSAQPPRNVGKILARVPNAAVGFIASEHLGVRP